MSKEKFELLAKIAEDEVCNYLKNKRCVNKLDARTQLALRVLDIISKFEMSAFETALELGTLKEEREGISAEANKLRDLVYGSLKEY